MQEYSSAIFGSREGRNASLLVAGYICGMAIFFDSSGLLVCKILCTGSTGDGDNTIGRDFKFKGLETMKILPDIFCLVAVTIISDCVCLYAIQVYLVLLPYFVIILVLYGC